MSIAVALFLIQTVTFFAVIALAVAAYRRSAKPAMEQAALIPFQDEPDVLATLKKTNDGG